MTDLITIANHFGGARNIRGLGSCIEMCKCRIGILDLCLVWVHNTSINCESVYIMRNEVTSFVPVSWIRHNCIFSFEDYITTDEVIKMIDDNVALINSRAMT